MLSAVQCKVVKQKQWRGMITRVMPTAFQWRSKAAAQQRLSSGLFEVGHFSHLYGFAYGFSAESQKNYPLFTPFLNAFLGLVADEQIQQCFALSYSNFVFLLF